MRNEKTTITLRPAQMEVFRSPKRFRVLVAGRRFGKTQLALVELLRAAASGPKQNVWYVAPSYRQAKRIAWNRLKELTKPYCAGKPNESELSIQLRGGGVIALRGADQYDSLRGDGLDFLVLDEYASMRPECWTEVLRPALSDRRGRALFIGTPQPASHLRDTFEQAERNEEWQAFRYTTAEGGNVSEDELASAAREMDDRLYRQEFEASFEGIGHGQAYYAFSRTENVRPCQYDPQRPLIWSLDFNVHPMSSVLLQQVGEATQVLDEMVLPNANTPAACDELLRRTEAWRRMGTVRIDVYGDASGYQRRTSGAASDWALIREFFARWTGQFQPSVRAATSNPAVRDRVNVVNSRLCSASGHRRLIVDPKCRELIQDLERVSWKTDGAGQPTDELDKSDRLRTHISDALGYYLSRAFPLRLPIGHCGTGRVV